MKKYRVAIVSTGDPLNSIIKAIDMDSIEICSIFGIWHDIDKSLQKSFKSIFYPLDMLPLKVENGQAEYFLVNINQNVDRQIIKKLIALNIPKENIMGMWPFGSLSVFNYMYFLQWQYLINIQSKTYYDFIVTGNSYFKYGVDLNGMLPWNGINLSRDSQDFYYS